MSGPLVLIQRTYPYRARMPAASLHSAEPSRASPAALQFASVGSVGWSDVGSATKDRCSAVRIAMQCSAAQCSAAESRASEAKNRTEAAAGERQGVTARTRTPSRDKPRREPLGTGRTYQVPVTVRPTNQAFTSIECAPAASSNTPDPTRPDPRRRRGITCAAAAGRPAGRSTSTDCCR